MLRAGLLRLVAVFAAPAVALAQGDPAGPYFDSQGRVWETLPAPSEYSSVAEWDALFALEVFSDPQGRRFQIDRELTPEELDRLAGSERFFGGLQAERGPGGGIRATVNVHCPADEEYRSYFGSSWQSHINSVVESADNALYSSWGIDFVVRRYCSWDSSDSATISGLLDEAFRECGYGGQEMMIAFSNDPTPGGAVGIAYILSPRMLVKRYYSYENVICQHEAGHTYGCYHCCVSTCVMQPTVAPSAFGRFHNYQESCSGQNHWSVMNTNRNRY